MDPANRRLIASLHHAPYKCVLALTGGCTASLATDRPKRGDHRVHVSYCHGDSVSSYSLILTKGARDRSAEEAVVDQVILTALARAFRIAPQLEVSLLPEEKLEIEDQD